MRAVGALVLILVMVMFIKYIFFDRHDCGNGLDISALEEAMAHHRVCPWWMGYLLLSPIRKWRQDPTRILAPYVRADMTVLEPGPGMGFFTLVIARLVGPSGRVIAVDVQPRMIEALRRRARRAGLADRIDARTVSPSSMELSGLDAAVDFVFAFAVVHEMPSAAFFFLEAARAMKSGAGLLLTEPAGHVSEEEFQEEITAARAHGIRVIDRPPVKGCIAALMRKP